MDLFTILGSCLRRWYFTLPLILLAGTLAFRAYEAVPAEYSASVSIVVLPHPQAQRLDEDEDSEEFPGNPYSGQGGSKFAVAVLTRNINSPGFRERLGLEDAPETYLADSAETQPIITIDATARSVEHVYQLLDDVLIESNQVLAEFQQAAGAPQNTLYRAAPAVPVGPTVDVTPSRFRAAGAIGVLGLALTAGIAAGFDSLLVRRGRRRLVGDRDDSSGDDLGATPLDTESAEPSRASEADHLGPAAQRGSSEAGPEEQQRHGLPEGAVPGSEAGDTGVPETTGTSDDTTSAKPQKPPVKQSRKTRRGAKPSATPAKEAAKEAAKPVKVPS